jgi:hypothetical protein
VVSQDIDVEFKLGNKIFCEFCLKPSTIIVIPKSEKNAMTEGSVARIL